MKMTVTYYKAWFPELQTFLDRDTGERQSKLISDLQCKTPV